MNNEGIKFFLILLLCIFLQILVFNNINISQSYNPYLYLLFIILFNGKGNKYLFLWVSFLAGFVIDLSSFTGGTHAFSTVFLAYSRDFIIRLSFGKEASDDEFRLANYNFFQKSIFIILCVFLHHFLLYSLDHFNLYNIGNILLNTFYSSIITLLMVQIYFGLFYKNIED